MNPGLEATPQSGTRKGLPPGRRLAEARLARNLTAADVARQLKLSVSQVNALEADRYQQLPGPIFVRGFIRNYARLVKLDAGDLLRDGGDTLPQPEARREAPPSHEIPFPGRKSPPWRLYGAVAAAIFGALALYEFYWNEPEARAPVSVAPVSTPSVSDLTSAATAPRESSVATQATPSAGGTVAIAPAAQRPADGLASAPLVESVPARPGERQVTMNFNDESWVEIRDRNERVIFSQLNRPGTQQSVQGLPPFSIVVGNAHGVRLMYRERAVNLEPYTKIDVARLILP